MGGEVGHRATLVRQLLTTGAVTLPSPHPEVAEVAVTVTPGTIQQDPGGVAALATAFVRHGLTNDQLAAASEVTRLCAGATTPAAKQGCWLDTLVWAQHRLVDGAALGARSQALPGHEKGLSRKARRALAADTLARRARALRQVAEAARGSVDPEAWIAAAGPGGWQAYRALRDALDRYRGLARKAPPLMGEDYPVADKDAWRKRSLRRRWLRKLSDAHVARLRERLCFEGYCPPPPPQAPPDRPLPKRPHRLETELREQLRLWQRDRGLRDHGHVDKPTRKALDVPMAARVETLRLDLQRMRDTGAGGEPHVLIANVPAFELHVWKDGKRVRTHRTQVGKGVKRVRRGWIPGHRTPLISARLRYLVLNPEWVVPTSIRREYRWKIRKDPDFLSKNGFELRKAPGGDRMVMLAGEKNLLGRVKFLFPNQHLVYLHDTPSKRAFRFARRTRSHGCVRVEHAEDLARYLLDAETPRKLTRKRWDKLMARSNNRWRGLRKVVMVHLVYWTSDVSPKGRVRFFPDVYRYDARDRSAWQQADRARLAGLPVSPP